MHLFVIWTVLYNVQLKNNINEKNDRGSGGTSNGKGCETRIRPVITSEVSVK